MNGIWQKGTQGRMVKLFIAFGSAIEMAPKEPRFLLAGHAADRHPVRSVERRNGLQSIVITCVFLLVAAYGGSVYAQVNPPRQSNESSLQNLSIDEIKTRMTANDAQFDNVKAQYEIDYYRRADASNPIADSIKQGKPLDSEIVQDADGTFRIKNADGVDIDPRKDTFIETMVVRWPDLAGLRKLPDDVVAPVGLPEVHRWRSVGTEVREMTAHRYQADNPELEWIVEIQQQRIAINPIQESCIFKKLALGIGYGKRITEVSVKEGNEDSQLILEGGFRLWGTDRSRCRLTLDDNFIVRDASIHCDVNGRTTDFHVSTEGTRVFGDGGFQCAEVGHFRRLDGQTGQFERRFDIHLQSITLDLSDDDFSQFASFEPPSNAERKWIIDHDEPLQERKPLEPEQSGVWRKSPGATSSASPIAGSILKSRAKGIGN